MLGGTRSAPSPLIVAADARGKFLLNFLDLWIFSSACGLPKVFSFGRSA